MQNVCVRVSYFQFWTSLPTLRNFVLMLYHWRYVNLEAIVKNSWYLNSSSPPGLLLFYRPVIQFVLHERLCPDHDFYGGLHTRFLEIMVLVQPSLSTNKIYGKFLNCKWDITCRLWFSGLWRRVVLWVVNVSEEGITSIFKVGPFTKLHCVTTQKTTINISAVITSILRWDILYRSSPWWWRQQGPLKRW
jgi:hypothetical protein